MTAVVVGSISGSPGVTRVAVGLAAAWPGPERRVLVEADSDGGRLGAELGVGVEPGLMALATAARAGQLRADDVVHRGAAAAGDWYVVPAPASAEQAHGALTHAAAALADTVGWSDDAWIIDAGRLSLRAPALAFARQADTVLLVTSGSFPALQLVPHRVDALRRVGCPVAIVVVEPTWWTPAEIADFVGADIAAVLPRVRTRDDRLSSMRSSAWRPWWRGVERLAARCRAAGSTDAEHEEESALTPSGPEVEREVVP